MVRIVTGDLGAGKTLMCAMEIYKHLCAGLTVITNIDIVFAEMAKLARKRRRIILSEKQLIKLNPNEDRNWQEAIPMGVQGAPLQVYLDEIHLFYNSRDWQRTQKDNSGLLSYLTQSRKAAVDITFVTQEVQNVESQFRRIAEYTLYVVNTAHMAIAMPIRLFCVVKRDARHGNLIGKEFRRYDPTFFRCYNSFEMLDDYMKRLSDKAVRIERHKLPRIGVARWVGESLVSGPRKFFRL